MHDLIIKAGLSGRPAIGVLGKLGKHRLALLGALIILLLLFVAALAPFIAPHDPCAQNLAKRLSPDLITATYTILTDPLEQNKFSQLLQINLEFPLGTDQLGRCILSRLIYGTRVTLQIGIMVAFISSLIGVALGLIAGYRGAWLDELIMRGVDILLAFPAIILALVIVGGMGPGLYQVTLALVLVGWPSYARLTRGSALAVKEREFVKAAILLGLSEIRIILRHVLPNVISPVLVMASLGVAHAILIAAALSFLGLGTQPPTPEWGSMLNEGRAFMLTAPHLTLFPGMAIMITVLAFNFLGDGLRDALDPRWKGLKPFARR